MAMPRFLPLVFVAVGGVLALKAISSLDIMPDVFHAAEAIAAPAPKAAPKTPAKAKPAKGGGGEVTHPEDPSESYAVNPALLAADANAKASDAAAVAPVAPVCATSLDQLAQQAGMSTNELTIIQSLGQRRAQLDAREQQLNSRGQLIEAADAKLDGRIQQLSDLKTQIQALLDKASSAQGQDTNRLIAVYAAMKPKDAAAVFATMDDDVRLPIAAGMKDRGLAAILGAMPATDAKDLTQKLARRMQGANAVQQALDKAAAGGPGATPAPAKPGAAPAAKTPPAKK